MPWVSSGLIEWSSLWWSRYLRLIQTNLCSRSWNRVNDPLDTIWVISEAVFTLHSQSFNRYWQIKQYRKIHKLNTTSGDVVVLNVLELGYRDPGPDPATILLGKLFTHIASPVFSAPKKLEYKREYLDWSDLTAQVNWLNVLEKATWLHS